MTYGDQWSHLEPQRTVEEILVDLIDTQAMEIEHAMLKVYIEDGVLDYMIFMTQGSGNDPNQVTNIVNKLNGMRSRFDTLSAEIERHHEANHNLLVQSGYASVSADQTAYGSHYGVTSYQNNQWGYNHNPYQTGQPGYPPQHPSMGQLLWGGATRLAGV